MRRGSGVGPRSSQVVGASDRSLATREEALEAAGLSE
jgi:hypothetical protein